MPMMTYQTVPMPLNAAEKLAEAGYFFNRMLVLQHNAREFIHNLSAFLSALRSITENHLPKQFSKHPVFKEWFARKIQELEADPLFIFLVESRNQTVHRGPIKEVYYQAGPPIPDEGIETNHFEWTHTTDDYGNIICTMKVGKEGQEIRVTPVVHWVFRLPEERELLTTCRYGLERMDAMLGEWQRVLARSPSADAKL